SRSPSEGVMKPKPLASLNHFTVPVVRMRYSCVTMGPDSTYGTSRQMLVGYQNAPHVGQVSRTAVIYDSGPMGRTTIGELWYAVTAATCEEITRRLSNFPSLPSKTAPRLGKPRVGRGFVVNVNRAS